MESKPERHFEYIDSFYYKSVNSESDEGTLRYIVFHIIQDCDSKRFYAIEEKNTNVLFQKIMDETKILRIDNENGITIRKDMKEVSFDDVGSFWIDEEIANCFQDNGDYIIINYFGEKDKLKKV